MEEACNSMKGCGIGEDASTDEKAEVVVEEAVSAVEIELLEPPIKLVGVEVESPSPASSGGACERNEEAELIPRPK